MRSRDSKKLLLILVFLSSLFILIAFFRLDVAVIGFLLTWFLGGYCLFLLNQRDQRVRELSHYVKDITLGRATFDFRDHVEGELSTLKSDLYKVTTMLTTQSETLLAEKRLLASYLSDISHQLKTPLTSIMMMADLLNNEHLPSEKRLLFQKQMDDQLERMEWLVTSLLKISKLDANTVIFRQEKLQIQDLVKQALQPLSILMDLKDQQLLLDIGAELTIEVDRNWTAEALTNILKNGVEHTQAGGELRISSFENPLYIAITIADDGKGINKSDLPYIFQRFYKGKNASDESVGIGLAMAHSIIKKQGGDLTVRSEEGIGTVFTIKFYKV